MSEMVTIENTEMKIREYNGQRVVTLKDIDKVHEKKDGTSKSTFNRYKKHFVENEDYFKLTRKELRDILSPNDKIVGNPNIETYLITESGYLMIVKAYTDELAWQVQRQLVNSYFRRQAPIIEQQKLQLTTEEIVDWKLNDLHKRLQALEKEKSDRPKVQMLTRLTPRKETWYEKNRNRIWRIRYDKNMELKELYHLILEECSKYYDLDEAEQIYRDQKGCKLIYPIDVVEYFPELQDIANQVLDYFEG